MSYVRRIETFEELLDANILTPNIGDILEWDGTDWVNVPNTAFTCEAVQDCMGTALAPFTTYDDINDVFTLNSISDHNDVNVVIPVVKQFLTWNGTEWVNTSHQHVPVSDILLNSKIGPIVNVAANYSSTTLNGDTLTYSWTTIPGSATIATPSSISTNITFTSLGEYQIVLDVTNSDGVTHQTRMKITVDRIIEIGGVDSQHNSNFTSLQSAYNWINANDAGGASQYLIIVNQTTTDFSRIIPNFARVFFTPRGKLRVGVDFTVAGNYYWSGNYIEETSSFNTLNIDTSTGHAITASANCRLYFARLGIRSTDPAGNSIESTNGTLYFQSCLFQSEKIAINSNGSFLDIKYCKIVGRQSAITSTTSVFVHGCDIQSGFLPTPNYAISITNSPSKITNNKITVSNSNTTTTEMGAISIDSTTNINPIDISNNYIEVNVITAANVNVIGIKCVVGLTSSKINISNNHINCSSTYTGGNFLAGIFCRGANFGIVNIISNNSITVNNNPLTFALVLFNTVGLNWIFSNNLFIDRQNLSTTIVTSTSSPTNIIPSAITTKFLNNVLVGNIDPLITPTAGIAFAGENIRV